MPNDLPSDCAILIIGGGAVGASVAYHLGAFGAKNVVLLEQNQLGAGTTWHAAGMVGRLRTSNSLTRINQYSADLYSRLEADTGHSVGWKQVGSVIVARSPERMVQLRRTTAMAELLGVEACMISAAEAGEKYPLMRTDDLLGAAWLPHDGKVIPREIPVALAKGAAARGVHVREGVRVISLLHDQGRVTGVETDHGTIRAGLVVLCGGMWARQLALAAGVSVPLYPVEHHYVVSNPIPGAHDALPLGRDPDLCIYFRGEGNGIMLGAFQKYTKPWNAYPVAPDFAFRLLEPDWDKYQEPLAAGKWRLPCLESSGFERFVNGPESFTPDNQFLLGETPELRGLFVAAGFNSVGIASAGGVGKYLAEWILEGQPTMDLWSVDIRRFGPLANNLPFLRERVTEVLGLHYQMAWPNRELESARDLRQSPLHAKLDAAGACFGVRNGWERPNWFASGCQEPLTEYSFGRQNWFDNQAREHRAAREAVALFDQSAFGKLAIKGRDACAFLQRLCGNDVDVAVGRVVYTGLFNARGGFESDVTLVRLKRDEYLMITGSSQVVRDADWLGRQRQPEEHVEWMDVTADRAVIGVMGPRSRELLSRLTREDLSNSGFPFGAARVIDLGRARVLALRMTYVGELGWELHLSASQAVELYLALKRAGDGLGLLDAGHYAIQSLRLEKAYRAWGSELSIEETPLEAGLGFAVGWNKPMDFVGRAALIEQRRRGWRKQLLTFVLEDPQPVLWGSEPILLNGRPVGYTTSGSYGHTLGAAVGMGYVKLEAPQTAAAIPPGRFEIDVNGVKVSARAFLKAPYDPNRSRILI